MKQWMNFVVALPMLIVYFFGIYAPSVNYVKTAVHCVSESNDAIKAGHSIDASFHLLNSENSTSWVNSNVKTKQQSLNYHFIAIAIVAEQVCKATFLQRKYCSKNTISLYRSAQIFYPFHSFW